MTTTLESFEALFEESLARQEMRTGEVITAEVVNVDQNFVTVNAGLKSESLISVDEFKNDNGEVDVKIGDFVTVAIDSLENGYGETKLSREKAKRMAAWIELEEALESGTILSGIISGKVKGGLTVMLTASAPSCPVRWLTPVQSKTPPHSKASKSNSRSSSWTVSATTWW